MSFRGNAQRRPDNQVSVNAARLQLQMLLANATDERLLSFTPEGLAGMYRVPIREIECLLLARQEKRRREIAAQG